MRELWIQSLEQGPNPSSKSTDPQSDPFMDDEVVQEQLLGISQIYLSFLKYGASFTRKVPIFDSKGSKIGALSVEMFPCNDQGQPLRQLPLSNEPKSLLGKNLRYCIKLSALSLPSSEISTKVSTSP